MKGRSMFSAMSSFPVMFLSTLLLSSILTEGRVLTQTQKEPTISADHMTNVKAVLDKVDCQCKGTNTEDLHRVVSASHQDERSSEDLANVSKNMLHLSTVLSALKKLYAPENQVDSVSFCCKAHRPEGTETAHQQDNSTCIFICTLVKLLNLVRITFVSY
ncbi:uncharacterized protein LOC121133287 isoform X2 [Mesocricetus auratus]|uniref:Uncharacterized protein LOC121133287 isoform X2 n=1 Tax=Mesocricetus auratus TaxID=10036 RepID=A0ABM2W4H3_MESAU|nr:uncharacterized protein LOC121133287 isoform X2 [Mesocricetus auratus]